MRWIIIVAMSSLFSCQLIPDTNHGGAVECGAINSPVLARTCDRLEPLACSVGEFCNYPSREVFLEKSDVKGRCTPIPTACTKDLNPVCGFDNVTYDNACLAAQNGISVASCGPCIKVVGPCGPWPTDGGSTQCDVIKPPENAAFCGGLNPQPCSVGEFCNYPKKEDVVGIADVKGRCTPIPTSCPKDINPVCGFNDVTYDNACLAAQNGISVASCGSCFKAVP